jgi:hypothetical protein
MSTLLLAAVATLVFCAPGYPGGAGDAQPFVDQFATATAAMAGWPAGSLTAVYDPTEKGGLAKLGNADAELAFVPYPFFVQYAAELHLTPLAQAQVIDVGSQERWTLVGKAGAVPPSPASLSGYTLLSVAGYAPDFVRRAALGHWPLPPDVKIEATGQILSALRRIAAGEQVLALLDQTQATALPSLPFAAGLQTLTQSPALPVALVTVVGGRLSEPRARAVQAGLLKMGHAAGEADTLRQLRLQGFMLPQIPAQPATP